MAFTISGDKIVQSGTDNDLSGLSALTGVTYSEANGLRIADISETLAVQIDGDLTIDPTTDLLIHRKDGNSTFIINGSLTLGREIDRGNGIIHYTPGTALRAMGRSAVEWSSNIVVQGQGALNIYGAMVASAGAIEARGNATLKIREGKFHSLPTQRVPDGVHGNNIYLWGTATCDILGLYKTNRGGVDDAVSIRSATVTVLNLSGITASGNVMLDDRAAGASTKAPLGVVERIEAPVSARAVWSAGHILNSQWHIANPTIGNRDDGRPASTRGGELQALRDIAMTFTTAAGTPIEGVRLYFEDIDNGNRGDSASTQWAALGYAQDYRTSRVSTALSNQTGLATMQIMEAAWYNTDQTNTSNWVLNQAPDIRINADYSIPLTAAHYTYSLQPLKGQGSVVGAYEASVALVADVDISEPDIAVVRAYGSIDTSAQFYDAAKAWLYDNFSGQSAPLVARTGAEIDAGSYDVRIDKNAAQAFDFDGTTITIKSTLFTGDVRTTGTLTLANGAGVRGFITDSAADSALVFIGIDAWTLYPSQNDRDNNTNAIASGAGGQNHRFNFAGPVTYFMRVTSGATVFQIEAPVSAAGKTEVELSQLALLQSINANTQAQAQRDAMALGLSGGLSAQSGSVDHKLDASGSDPALAAKVEDLHDFAGLGATPLITTKTQKTVGAKTVTISGDGVNTATTSRSA